MSKRIAELKSLTEISLEKLQEEIERKLAWTRLKPLFVKAAERAANRETVCLRFFSGARIPLFELKARIKAYLDQHYADFKYDLYVPEDRTSHDIVVTFNW